MNPTPSIFYQIFVRSFSDHSQDGIGDLKGITHKLEYLAYLGVEGIWLSPIFLSPSYHKYDVQDYYQIAPEYGTMEDFDELVRVAASYDIKVVLDLVVSHTSDRHPWFIEAQKDTQNPYRHYYLWKTSKQIKDLGLENRTASADTGIIKPWHKKSGNREKYYGVFSPTMPDLNLENLQTRIEILEIARFWLRKGVYGFRLDAAKHLYPAWVPMEKNTEFWQALKDELKKDFPEVFLVGEVWGEPEEVAPFYKGLDSNFNFELCYDIRETLIQEQDVRNLVEKLLAAYSIYSQSNPGFIDATFLGNHDQERIASVLKNNKAKIKAALNLLMTLPGLPFIYYGEELGTQGKKPDQHLREPFIWNYLENDWFRTRWQRDRYSTEKKLIPLSVQSAEKNSVFNHYRKLLHLRKSSEALKEFSHSSLQRHDSRNPFVISFRRTKGEENLLVLQNVSKYPQTIDMDLEIEEILFSSHSTTLHQDKVTVRPFGLIVLNLK